MSNPEDDVIETTIFKHFHLGNAITLVISLIALGITWGTLKSDIEGMKEDISYNSRLLLDPAGTPGANKRISMVELTDSIMAKDLMQQRTEMADYRREIKAQLDRIEDKIDDRKLGGR